jgi:hypothetical protein
VVVVLAVVVLAVVVLAVVVLAVVVLAVVVLAVVVLVVAVLVVAVLAVVPILVLLAQSRADPLVKTRVTVILVAANQAVANLSKISTRLWMNHWMALTMPSADRVQTKPQKKLIFSAPPVEAAACRATVMNLSSNNLTAVPWPRPIRILRPAPRRAQMAAEKRPAPMAVRAVPRAPKAVVARSRNKGILFPYQMMWVMVRATILSCDRSVKPPWKRPTQYCARNYGKSTGALKTNRTGLKYRQYYGNSN